MTRTALAVLAACSSCQAAAAAAPSLLVLDDWGEYAATIHHRFTNPGAAVGYSNSVGNVRLIARTHDICARLGTHFGLTYHLLPGAPVAALHVITAFDHPPLQNSHGGMQTRDELDQVVGRQPAYSDWYFEYPRELVAGEWRMTVRYGSTVAIDETFHIRTACGAPVA